MIVGMNRDQIDALCGLGDKDDGGAGWAAAMQTRQMALQQTQSRFGLSDEFIGGIPNQTIYGGLLAAGLAGILFRKTSGPTRGFGKAALTVATGLALLWAAGPVVGKFMGK